MKNSSVVAGIVALAVLLVLGYWWLAPSGFWEGASAASARVATAQSAAQTSAQTTATQTMATQATAMAPGGDTRPAVTDSNANLSAGVTSASSLPNAATTAKSASGPALTRALEPPPTFQIDGRKWAVLGTRDVPQGNTQQTVLVLRDEASGQLDYRQPALRFELQPGTDYEAFIRERRNAQRVFVNPLYGDVSVDSAYIAAEYTALADDKRVVKVQFIPLVVPTKPR